MATHKFATPIRVGDLANGITVDALELVGISINFQPVVDTDIPGAMKGRVLKNRVIVSCVLHHAASGWTHTITLSEHTGYSDDANGHPVSNGVKAAQMWEAIKAKFPDFEKEILAMLADYLPEGTIA